MESPDFRTIVEELENLKEIDIVGCCTDICVTNGAIALANYYDQKNKEIEIRVVEDAVETYHSENHDRKTYSDCAKILMKQQGIKLI